MKNTKVLYAIIISAFILSIGALGLSVLGSIIYGFAAFTTTEGAGYSDKEVFEMMLANLHPLLGFLICHTAVYISFFRMRSLVKKGVFVTQTIEKAYSHYKTSRVFVVVSLLLDIPFLFIFAMAAYNTAYLLR